MPGQVSAPDQGEPPPPHLPPPQDVRSQVAAGDGRGEVAAENQGEPEIVKSPSDPKKYRWERSRQKRQTGCCDVSFSVNSKINSC